MSKKTVYKDTPSNPAPKGKPRARLISPAKYKEGTTRANSNVISWASWCAVDVDEYVFEDPSRFKEELLEKYGEWEFLCYSTASSRPEYPKFRMCFPLTEELFSCDIKKFWYSLNTELEGMADKQTKDLSRLFYVPGNYPGANNFIFENKGKFIDPEALIEKHPYPEVEKSESYFESQLSDDIKRQMQLMRMGESRNTDYTWSSYRDCPFVNREMIVEYSTITGTGWYHKLYSFMVSIAANAKRKKYPITPTEISNLCRELDRDTGSWYQERPLEEEARRAIEFVYS